MMIERPIPFRPDPSAVNAAAMRSLVRASICESTRIFERSTSGTLPSADAILKRKGWADDRRAGMLTRASVGPAMTTQAGWAQELAQVSIALLESLTPMSAAAQLLAQGLNLSFGGAATIRVPGIGTGQAGWVAEGQPIRALQFLSTGPTLSPHKLASISELTEEMLRNSNAEQMVRTALTGSTAPALDAALFSATAASAAQPAGILVGAISVTASVSTDKFDALGDDLGALVSAIGPYAGNGSVTLIANPMQAVRATLYTGLSFPVLMTSALPVGTVVAVANNALASIVEAPAIDAANATSLHLEDTNPQAIGSASPAKSMYQTSCVALRIRLPISWVIRNPLAVAVVTSTHW